MINRYALSSLAFAGLVQPACAYDVNARLDLEPLIVKHAAANNVPAALVHRIVIRESRYNPRAVGRGGAMGLMQIKHATARALGYAGSPAGLLDAETNLTYGVRYLAGAYRVANGDQNRAVGFYARGYYYDAKRLGMLGALAKRPAVAEEPVVAVAAPQPAQTPSLFSTVLAPPQPAEPTQPVQAMIEEPDHPLPPRRSRSSAKARAAAVASPLRAAPVPAETSVQAVQAVETPVDSTAVKRRKRSAERPASPAESATTPGAAQPMAEGAAAEAPAKRSVRSAKRSATSGADRSERKASAPPGDSGRSP